MLEACQWLHLQSRRVPLNPGESEVTRLPHRCEIPHRVPLYYAGGRRHRKWGNTVERGPLVSIPSKRARWPQLITLAVLPWEECGVARLLPPPVLWPPRRDMT